MGHPSDAVHGILAFLNYREGEEALLIQAGRGMAAIEEEIERNGTGVCVLRCVCVAFVCVGMCVLRVCVCHAFLLLCVVESSKSSHTHTGQKKKRTAWTTCSTRKREAVANNSKTAGCSTATQGRTRCCGGRDA